jgi:hypothetical protein
MYCIPDSQFTVKSTNQTYNDIIGKQKREGLINKFKMVHEFFDIKKGLFG